MNNKPQRIRSVTVLGLMCLSSENISWTMDDCPLLPSQSCSFSSLIAAGPEQHLQLLLHSHQCMVLVLQKPVLYTEDSKRTMG